VDGHIYYNNNVIKIRYDLFNNKGIHYKENELFDYYFNIFELQKGERVRANTPLDSMRSHRFGYIISNKEIYSTLKIILMPYLHENKIYLNREKINTNYFYTSMETELNPLQSEDNDSCSITSIICVNITEAKFFVFSQSGLLIKNYNFEDIVEQYGEITTLSSNG
jgi:hypothetical protein